MVAAMSDKRVSSSRLGRFTRLGWLGRKALPIAWKRLKETAEAPAEERGALAAKLLKKHSNIADKAFRTLGDMKGVALKVGQMLSYMDGAIPEEYSAVYQDVLTRLQQQAPSLRWDRIRPVIEAELGPLDETFTSIEQTPFAAASIGQVHRGVLQSGEAVAVKVQYPGVDRAMVADLKNADTFRAMLTPFLSMMGAGRDTRGYVKEIMAEVRQKLLEELDYEREATNQTRFHELLAGDPEVVVPRIFQPHSTKRVLVSELIAGRTLRQVCDEDDQERRNRYAVILTRTMIDCLHVHGLFNADPHPGNYLFLDDGRVCFLDYGCVKEIPDWMRHDIQHNLRLAIRATRTEDPADWARFDDQIARAFKLDRTDDKMFRLYREMILYIMRPALRPGPFDFTTAYTKESIDRVLDGIKETVWGRGKLPRIPNVPPVPPDYTFLNRLQWGFFSILTMLRARFDWHALVPPHVRDPDSTRTPNSPEDP